MNDSREERIDWLNLELRSSHSIERCRNFTLNFSNMSINLKLYMTKPKSRVVYSRNCTFEGPVDPFRDSRGPSFLKCGGGGGGGGGEI